MTWSHSHPSAWLACRGRLRRGEALFSPVRHVWVLALLAACWSSHLAREINLAAAEAAGLKINSRLQGVTDVVKRK